MTDEVLCRVDASAPRRWLGIGVLTALGAMVLYLAFAAPPAGLPMQVLLIGLGLGALWLADRMYRGTAQALELTGEGLRTTRGERLARSDEMLSIDRGAFAFKPSHGFTLKLDRSAAFAWQPGLYWRIGTRLGVGGITSGAQTKLMADMIAAMIAERG